jgi:membrane-bound lytic murein transglycosylase A
VSPRGGIAALVAAATLLGGCGVLQLRPRGPLVPVAGRAVPPLVDDLELGSLRTAVERTRPAWTRKHDQRSPDAAERLLAILEGTPDPAARRAALAEAFSIARVRDRLRLTAYYEPEIAGNLRRDAANRYPIYGRPPDLVDVDPRKLDPKCRCRPSVGRLHDGGLEPYFTRGEIDGGALAGRGLELAYAADPLQLFLLHVQGSGLLVLPNGRKVGVRYAATNGRPYQSLANVMIKQGILSPKRASLDEIKRALASRTEAEQRAILAANERFIFFRIANGGVTGSLGVELTPGRSIASDPKLVPPGTIAYLKTPTYSRFVVSQDTGVAVKGAHADLFVGTGAAAEVVAGRTHERGTLYLLQPR